MSEHNEERPGDGRDAARQRDSSDKAGRDKPSPLANPRVKWTLIIIGVLVVVLLVVWFVYWLSTGRYLQDTDNAYLKADAVAVAPRVNGYVTDVLVQDNQWVKAGQPLLRIDGRTYQAQMEQAEAAIAVREADIVAADANVAGQEAALLQARSQVTSAQATLKLAKAEVARFAPLVATGADTREHLESLQHDLARAQAQLEAAQAQVVGAESQADAARAQRAQADAGLKQARADADAARVAVEDTALVARIDGRIGDKTVQVGQFVSAGTRTMTVIPVDALYLQANFKETQMGLMRPGQPAEIEVDALSGVTLHGTVESISPGTGSQFALLPPENATGNFTKVVQRVPVRVRIDAGTQARKVLVPGMSVVVTVDTRGARDEKDQAQDEAEAGAGARR